jgi:tetratricopeptide (TPR) repeat protein
MLETLRQYAREQLDDSGETDRCRRALAQHLTLVARDAGEGVTGSEDALWFARVRADLDNIRATIAWGLDRDEPADRELALSILASLGEMAEMSFDLGLHLFANQAVVLVERSRPEIRIPLLTLAAFHHWSRGELDEARRLATSALDNGVVAAISNPLSPYAALVAFEMAAGNHARAFELADEARTHFDEIDNKFDEARMLAGLAAFEAMAGRADAARADSDRSLQLARRLGNQHLLVAALNGRAWALQRDDPEGALAVAEQFLEVQRQHGVQRNTVAGLTALAAGLHSRSGDDHRALPLLRQAVVIARDDGTLPQAAAAVSFALNPLNRTGRPDVAATLIGGLEGGALATVAGFPGNADSRARTLARIHDALGHEKTERCVTRGVSMTYDELMQYAIEQLGAVPPP